MTEKKSAKKGAKQSSLRVATNAANETAEPTDTLAGPPAAFPPGFSNPAMRALRNIGVTRLSELTAHREQDVAALHGMGPSGVKALKAALKAAGKVFVPDSSWSA